MKSLNQAERQSAFLKFIVFFAITFTLIIITAFFSAQVPLRENKQLKAEQLARDNEKDFLASFENGVQQTINLLNSLDTIKNYAATDVAIKAKIEELYTQVSKKDTISVKTLCNLILENLSYYHLAKIDLRNKNNDDETTQDLQQRIYDLEKLWRDCERASKATSRD